MEGGFLSLLRGMGVRHRVQRVSMEAMGRRKRTNIRMAFSRFMLLKLSMLITYRSILRVRDLVTDRRDRTGEICPKYRWFPREHHDQHLSCFGNATLKTSPRL